MISINEISFALMSMMAFGMVGIVYKVATEHMNPLSVVFFVYVFSATLMGVVWSLSPDKSITLEGMKLVVLASILAVIGMVSYMYALKLGEASVVVPIRNLALVVTVCLAITILKENMDLTKLGGIIMAVFALILLSR